MNPRPTVVKLANEYQRAERRWQIATAIGMADEIVYTLGRMADVAHKNWSRAYRTLPR
jgi:hypothetical protein